MGCKGGDDEDDDEEREDGDDDEDDGDGDDDDDDDDEDDDDEGDDAEDDDDGARDGARSPADETEYVRDESENEWVDGESGDGGGRRSRAERLSGACARACVCESVSE